MKLKCMTCNDISKDISDRRYVDSERVNKEIPEGLLSFMKKIPNETIESLKEFFNYDEAVNFLIKHDGHVVYFMDL